MTGIDIAPDCEIRGASEGAWFCQKHGFIANPAEVRGRFRCSTCRRERTHLVAQWAVIIAVAAAASLSSISTGAAFMGGLLGAKVLAWVFSGAARSGISQAYGLAILVTALAKRRVCGR